MTQSQKLTSNIPDEPIYEKKKRRRSASYVETPGLRNVAKNFRFSKTEYEQLVKRADEHFDGDICGWVRFCAVSMTPVLSDIDNLKSYMDGRRKLK